MLNLLVGSDGVETRHAREVTGREILPSYPWAVHTSRVTGVQASDLEIVEKSSKFAVAFPRVSVEFYGSQTTQGSSIGGVTRQVAYGEHVQLVVRQVQPLNLDQAEEGGVTHVAQLVGGKVKMF